MKRFLVLLALAALFAVNIQADVPRPEPTKTKTSKSIETTLMIKIDRNVKEAKLIIPKSQLKQLRAELEELDGEPDANAALRFNFTRTQTIASGLFLSLAFVFGGVFLARSRKTDVKANKTLGIGAVLFLSGALATIAYANAGPPPEARSITGKIFSQALHIYKFGSGKIKLEASDSAQAVELIVPDAPEKNTSKEEE